MREIDRLGPRAAFGRLIAQLTRLLLGEFIQELIQGGAQILGELANLLVRRIALQGIAQLLFRRAQIAFGVGKRAVLDLERHVPEIIRDIDEIGIALRVLQHA